MEILEMILVGGVGAAIATTFLKIVENLIMYVIKRKTKKQDEEDVAQTKFEKYTKDSISSLQVAMRAILQDRIKCACQSAIRAKEISFDDRANIISMHDVYHNNLNGNGNLDPLMDEIMHLSLK